MKILSVVGFKKTGKTTLVEALIRAFKGYGAVGTVKHVLEHDLNTPLTDTWKHSKAGADVVVAVTQSELVKFSKDNTLEDALDELADSGMDFAVVEGFKESTLPKIALGNVIAVNIIKTLDAPVDADIREIIDLMQKEPEYHTLNSLILKVKCGKYIEKAGAIGTFTGIVRAVTDNTHTEFLEFEEYRGLAKRKMDEICADLMQKEGVVDVIMHHKTGIIKKGEDIVYVVVAAGHREQLFPVLREAIERLKAEVPIWKKEHTLKGDWWVHDTQEELEKSKV
ncbi:MAG: molybdopterin synthase [Candidatus Methanoperedens sp.]|nr:molybdopterin synthase [Candidatus Methanoperedens sp.]